MTINIRWLTPLFCGLSLSSRACPLCENQQPKGFAGITHGTGPENRFDYLMLYGSIAIVLMSLGLLIYYIVRPKGESTQPPIDWHHG